MGRSDYFDLVSFGPWYEPDQAGDTCGVAGQGGTWYSLLGWRWDMEKGGTPLYCICRPVVQFQVYDATNPHGGEVDKGQKK